MWTLQEALQLIRDLQPQLKPLHYHVALGGGVLNKGTSQKDLDLYLLRFDNDDDGEAATQPTDKERRDRLAKALLDVAIAQ